MKLQTNLTFMNSWLCPARHNEGVYGQSDIDYKRGSV